MKRSVRPFHFLLWLLLLRILLESSAQATGWLATSGNHIVNADASVWDGRGANLHDTRSCGGGTLNDGTPINDNAAGVAEVKRRIDLLADTWKATFIRLDMETDGAPGAGHSYVEDAAYRSNIIEIVNYIGTKPGVYVLVSIWQDPSLDANGWPTAATNAILAKLATDFYASPHVLYGVSNEPQNNFGGAQDAQVWTAMNASVLAIRTAEALLGANRHIVTVQGTRDWARDLSYYITHPITAGGGVNVAYETHVYNSPADFASMLATPAASIPVIVGEFGPIGDAWHSATVADMQTLIDMAKANNIPHLAWTFHQYCPPNLIADTPGKTWDVNSTPADWHGMPIYPTDFGTLLINNLVPPAPALLNSSFNYNVTSSDDNVTRAVTAQVTRLNNFGAEKRPVVVLMPGWGGAGDVAAVRDAQANMFANNGYVAMNIGFHQTNSGTWYSDLAESAKAALDALCAQPYADCSAVALTGDSYGGTQIHPVVRYLRANAVYDGSGGANAGRKVLGILGQDAGYTYYWQAPQDADATAYSIAMIENLGDADFPVDSCDWGNCGARNRADYHQSAAGSQYVLSYCPSGGSHGSRGYADWDAWVLSAVKTMLHNQRGVTKFTGYVEPTLAVTNACLSNPASVPGAPIIGTATVGNAQATVYFTAPSSNGGAAISGYKTTCGTTTVSGISSPITVAPLINGTIYGCTVKATNKVGDSAPSAAMSVTPTAPVLPPTCTLTASPTWVSPGGSSTLTATCSPAATSYLWVGGTCVGTSGANCTVTPSVTTIYTVAGINGAGSGYVAAVTVAVMVTVTKIVAGQVVEFYNTNLDHYFITSWPGAAEYMAAGLAGPGWIQTGYSFASGGTNPVCRFYGSMNPGPNSHFYTVSQSDCEALKQLQAATPDTEKRWNYEGLDFSSTPPDSAGQCPNGTVPVYRAYNNGWARGVDSNHRIASNLAAIQEVVARGWTNEGVVMCAPADSVVSSRTFTSVNPTSGITWWAKAFYPSDASAAHRYPTIISVPGGTAAGSDSESIPDASKNPADQAGKGFVVVIFDADGRGNTPGTEDMNGYVDQDGLKALIEKTATLDVVDATKIGMASYSYGITMGSGVLARYPSLPIKFLVDAEGPADRADTFSCVVSDPRPMCSDELFWSEREAVNFIKLVAVPYLRIQNKTDHAGLDPSHCIPMINNATGKLYGGSGISPWTRVNLAAQNQPNKIYRVTSPPVYNPNETPIADTDLWIEFFASGL